MPSPLEGIRVLDFTHHGVGPWAACLLAEMGADVIKIEPPEGESMHRGPPPFKNGITTTFIAMNLNKRNITLDPRDERDRHVIYRLLETTDVIMDNRRPGYMDRRGLGYEEVSRRNPRIVYCSSTGYGNRGPIKDMGSADTWGQAISGFTSVNGPVGGVPEGLKSGGIAHLDLATSVYIVSGILTALYYREITGKGQMVGTSQMQACMALSGHRAQEYWVSGEDPVPMGSGVGNIVPSRAYRGSDGRYVSLTAEDEPTWNRLCQALGVSHLANDERFESNEKRVAHRQELDGIIEGIIKERPAAQWIEILEKHKVPCGLFFTMNQVRLHPQVKELHMVERIETPWGEMRVGGVPWRFSKTPAFITTTHLPGSDSEEVLASVGFTREQVPTTLSSKPWEANLRASGAKSGQAPNRG